MMGGATRRLRKGNTVLILGAGASFGARLGDSFDAGPPLGEDLAGYLLEWLAVNENDLGTYGLRRLEGYDRAIEVLREIDSTPKSDRPRFETVLNRIVGNLRNDENERNTLELSDLVERADHPDDRTETVINHIIARAFSGGTGCRFVSQPDLHDQLLEHLRDELLAIVTVNYDHLIEDALVRLGIPSRYAGYGDHGGFNAPDIVKAPAGEQQVEVYKFHGSIGWENGVPDMVGSSPNPPGPYWPAVPTVQDGARVSMDRKGPVVVQQVPSLWAWLKSGSALRYKPILATYAAGKSTCNGRLVLDAVQAAAIQRVRSAATIILLGLRPPDKRDDPQFSKLIDCISGCNERIYVSPDESDVTRMEELGFSGRCFTFEELLTSKEFTERGAA